MIRIQCPGCERTLQIKDTSAGEVKACPACGKKFRVPKAPANSVSVRPAADRKPARPAPPPDEDEVYEDLEVVAGPAEAEEEEGIQEKPRPSQARKKSRSADYEEVDEPDDRPRRRKTRKRRIRFLEDKEESADVFSWVSPFMLCVAGIFLGWCVLSGLSLFIPQGTGVLIGTGLCVAIAGRIWILFIASQEGDLRNVLIIPFYEIIFVINNIGETWKPCILNVVGILMLITGGILWAIHDAQEDFRPEPVPIHHHHHPLDDLDH